MSTTYPILSYLQYHLPSSGHSGGPTLGKKPLTAVAYYPS
jgi:hypothetical protein